MYELGQYAPKRSFQRRTKATSPPEVEETTTPNTDNTNKFIKRGGSKFKSPKIVEKSSLSNVTSDVENGAKSSFNSGARRNEFEKPARRGFVRRRQGGANGPSSTTQSSTSVSTTPSSLPSSTRRGFRIANRRRPINTPSTTTTTTTPAPTTTVPTPPPTTTEFIEESIQDIGDTDAIEDPSLEPRNSSKTPKTQRRPLLTLKDTDNDQNPSATNEEENKRQSKKYSATFKQNQLESFLRAMTTEGATTEFGTTAEELGPETALALAAFQLLTAPVPTAEDENTTPTKPTQATQEYKFTNTGYNDVINSQTPNYEDGSYKVNTARPNYNEAPTYAPEVENTKIASTNFETPSPNFSDIFPTKEIRPVISTITTDYDTSRISTLDIPKPTFGFPPRNTPSGFSLPSTDYDERSTRIPIVETTKETIIDSSKIPRRFTYSTNTDETRAPSDSTKQVSTNPSRGFRRPIVSTIPDEVRIPAVEPTRQTFTNSLRGSRRPTIATILQETETSSFETTRQTLTNPSRGFKRPTVSTISDETETPSFETTKQTLNNPSRGFKRPTVSMISDETETPSFETTRQTLTNPSRGFKRPTVSTISDETETYETTRQTFTNPSRGFKRPTVSTILDETETPSLDTTRQTSTNLSKGRKLTVSIPDETPSIETLFDIKSTDSRTVTEEYFETTKTYDYSTLSTPKLTSTLGTPRSTNSGLRSRQRFSSPNIIRPGYSGVSPSLSTEKFEISNDFGYSTATPVIGLSSQDPSLYTRDYLLESPVTKAYDEEYQYLLPPTSPQPPTRKIRKKLQRRISTTLRPTLSYSSTEASTERSSYSARTESPTTEKPRRTTSRKPFEKISTVSPSRTFRPIINYDYYDDSEEKIVEKYAEGTKVVLHSTGSIECLDVGNFPHPTSCKKFISCARMESGAILGWEYVCPKGLSFDPVGGICNWSAGLGCVEKDP